MQGQTMASPVPQQGWMGWCPWAKAGRGSQAGGLGVGNSTAFPGPLGAGEGRWEKRVTRGWGRCHESHACWAREFLSSGPKYSFIMLLLLCIWLCWILVTSRGIFPRVTGDLSSRHADSSCGAWAQQLWHQGVSAPWHLGMWDVSFLTRNQTHVPYIARQILNHWTTGQVSQVQF